jgi:hypothetical protein
MLTAQRIQDLFVFLNEELARRNVRGEAYLAGGAVMCLVPPEYLLAMKCLALRLGEEFHDLGDVAVLVRVLRLRTVSEAEAILGQY